MRLHILLRSTFLLLFAASPLALRAQFQDPTPDELKMTSDPKVPGAAAVYLYREETSDGDTSTETYYARIKVLSEKGKELATVQTPFEPGSTTVEKVEARTIHSDGRSIPLIAKPEDLTNFKSKYFREDTLVFTLPDVDVGSILEYRIRIHGIFMPRWDLQTAYFIHKEHFAFKPNSNIGGYWTIHDKPVNRLAATKTPVDAQIAIQTTKNQFVVDLNDVPPVPDDDWMPPINTLRWHVGFYYTYAATGKEFWDTEAKFWAQDVNEFTKVSGTIRNAANSLIAPGDTEDQKARKIYAAVEKLENTDYTHVRSDRERKKEKIKEIHSVEDVWKNRIGSGNALALLYVALAQAAGLKAWPMQVVDRSNAFFDGSNMNTDQFDDFIAIVSLGGKEVFLDPGEKVCPFGVLHWTHSLSAGFRESDTGPTLSQTPGQTYVGNHVQRVANLTLEADGSLTGTARIVMTGAEAIYWRQLALENDEGELKKKFEESLNDDLPEGVTAAFDHFVGLDDPEVNLMATVNLTGSLGAPAGKRLILPGLIFESRAKHPFVAEDKRTIPIDVHYPRMETDEAVLRLPEGYTVESSPKTADVSWPGYAALRINSETKDSTLDVARVFARNFSLLKPETYNDLHDFYLKLASADQQQIVLVRVAAAKGN